MKEYARLSPNIRSVSPNKIETNKKNQASRSPLKKNQQPVEGLDYRLMRADSTESTGRKTRKMANKDGYEADFSHYG